MSSAVWQGPRPLIYVGSYFLNLTGNQALKYEVHAQAIIATDRSSRLGFATQAFGWSDLKLKGRDLQSLTLGCLGSPSGNTGSLVPAGVGHGPFKSICSPSLAHLGPDSKVSEVWAKPRFLGSFGASQKEGLGEA